MMKKLLYLLLLVHFASSGFSQSCNAWIYAAFDFGTGTYHFSAYSSDSLNVPTAYLWNTGATSASIVPSASGSYCVTITFPDGCSASACHIYDACSISGLATTSAVDTNGIYITPTGGTAPYTILWANGNTGFSLIGVPTGVYCATVTDAASCTVDFCATMPDPDTIQCWVNIYPSGGGLYVQSGLWSNPQYLWSTGETGPFIYPVSPGTYCVTATNALGCFATACYSLQFDSICETHIEGWSNLDSTITLFAAPSSFGWPFMFAWSTGDTGQYVYAAQPGTYCVTVTNSAGCTSTACHTLYPNNVINLNVYTLDSLDGVLAEVYVIQYDTTAGMLTAIDTVQTDQYGWVSIENVPPGKYLLKAALLPNSPHYGESLPTYHTNKLYWNEALPVMVTPLAFWSGGVYTHIYMVPGLNPGGPGFVGGLISQGANFSGGGVDDRDEGDPLNNIEVILEGQTNPSLRWDFTEADGHFSFNNLPYGTYKIMVEIAGLPQSSQTVTIGPDNPTISNLAFVVDENSVGVSATWETSPDPRIGIYPNPVGAQLQLSLPGGKSLVSIRDVNGKTLLQSRETGEQAAIAVGQFAQGVYFVEVRHENRITTLKFVKQ